MFNLTQTLKYGLPFVSFVVLGSVMLREFTSIRYDVHRYQQKYAKNTSNKNDNYGLSDEEIEAEFQAQADKDGRMPREIKTSWGATIKRLSEAERRDRDAEEIRRMSSLGESNDYKNIRGPRPYEENSKEYNEMLASLKEKNAAEAKFLSGQ